ncbi:hypothetical protein L218DRAFT_860135, partial [Marasmius fiardii PR-910]
MTLYTVLPENPSFHSPFTRMLRTNRAPDKDEIQKIVSLLHEPQQKLDVLVGQIAQLEETLSKLKAERDSLQNFIDEHRALLAPFRRLPVDVVREIFLQCLGPYPYRSTKHAPLLFTTICKYWRQIALETPRLWCSIHLYIPCIPIYPVAGGQHPGEVEEFCNLVKGRMAGAERWIKRSGSVPLTISLAFQTGSPPRHPDHLKALQSIIETFIPYSSRWKELHIWNASAGVLVPLGMLKPDEVPKLESLEIVQGVEINTLRSLLQAPSLRKLCVVPSARPPLSELPVRWNQITEIHI